MRGDIANLSRAMLLRLSLAAAGITVAALFMYGAGSISRFSDGALLVALRTAAAAGFAAITFSASSLVATFTAPASGARFSPATIVASIVSGAVGLTALAIAALVLAVSGGLAP